MKCEERTREEGERSLRHQQIYVECIYDIECTYARTRISSIVFNDNTYFHSYIHSYALILQSTSFDFRLLIFFCRPFPLHVSMLDDNSASTSLNTIYMLFILFSLLQNLAAHSLFIALNNAAEKKNKTNLRP